MDLFEERMDVEGDEFDRNRKEFQLKMSFFELELEEKKKRIAESPEKSLISRIHSEKESN